jgi:hypothetical protein
MVRVLAVGAAASAVALLPFVGVLLLNPGSRWNTAPRGAPEVFESVSLRRYVLEHTERLPDLAAAAVVVLLLLGALLFFVRQRLANGVAAALVVALAAALIAAVVTVPLFQAVASWYRYIPHGSGRLRVTTWSDYYAWAEASFFALYAALILAALTCGWICGRMLADRGPAVAITAGFTTATYLVLTLPITDYTNSCLVGRAFLLNSHCG